MAVFDLSANSQEELYRMLFQDPMLDRGEREYDATLAERRMEAEARFAEPTAAMVLRSHVASCRTCGDATGLSEMCPNGVSLFIDRAEELNQSTPTKERNDA